MARVTHHGYTYLLKVLYRAGGPMTADELLALAGPTAALYGITGANIAAVLAVMTNKDKVFALRPDGRYELTDKGKMWGEVNSR
jgi:hypothetical protein